MRIAALFSLGLLVVSSLASCGPAMQNTVTMRCGESQSTTIGTHRCVVITSSEGDCPVRVTAQCKGESEKSTVVRGSGKTGRLCCGKAVGRVTFSTVGASSGTCKFTYGRDD